MIEAEKLLWGRVRNGWIGVKIYRQKAIFVQNEDSWFSRWIITDFYAPEKKLVIEIDGSIHTKKEIFLLDKEKEKLLKLRWYNIIRFTNEEVIQDIDDIIAKIQIHISPLNLLS